MSDVGDPATGTGDLDTGDAAEDDLDTGDAAEDDLGGDDLGGDTIVEEVLPVALQGERVDRVVSLLTGVPRTQAASLVVDGRVAVDGVVVRAGKQKLDAFAHIRIAVPPAVDDRPGPEPEVVVPVVYADDQVIVVDKPAGLVVHPGHGQRSGTLVNGLLARFPELAGVGEIHRPGIVHRLDKGTSGLLVVARTEAARVALVDALAAHEVHRVYRALVWGHPERPQGVIDAPIARSPRNPLLMALAPAGQGREARTHYRVLRRFARIPGLRPELAEVRCELETGRTHQIRVHLAAIGHPVVGDRAYGARHDRGSLVDRPFLHAEELAFRHPGTGEEIRFVAPLPADLGEILAGLGPEPDPVTEPVTGPAPQGTTGD